MGPNNILAGLIKLVGHDTITKCVTMTQNKTCRRPAQSREQSDIFVVKTEKQATEEIFVQFGELDKLDRISHAWIRFNYSLPQHKSHSTVLVKVAGSLFSKQSGFNPWSSSWIFCKLFCWIRLIRRDLWTKLECLTSGLSWGERLEGFDFKWWTDRHFMLSFRREL